MVQGNGHWAWLQADAGIADTVSLDGLPAFSLDVPADEQWAVTFNDGVATVFTPQLRLISNTDHPAVDAGYALMARVAALIAEQAPALGIQPVFTVIPTKELVHVEKVRAAGLEVPEPYRELVAAERARLDALAARLQALAGARYVDVLEPLQRAALEGTALYMNDTNGHPAAAGYRVIGERIAAALTGLLPEPPRGLYAYAGGDSYYPVLVNTEGLWHFESIAYIQQNGWPEGDLRKLSPRQALRLPFQGVIDHVDPRRFGPACCRDQE
jgi:hypothetical protein